MSLVVSHIFHCVFITRHIALLYMLSCCLCLWPCREDPSEGWWIPTCGSCALWALWENLQDLHHGGRPGRGSHVWCESRLRANTLSVHDMWPFFISCVVLNIDLQWHNGPMIDSGDKFRKLRKDILFGDWCNNRPRWSTVCWDFTEWYKNNLIVSGEIFCNNSHRYQQGHLTHITKDLPLVFSHCFHFICLCQSQHNCAEWDFVCVAQT